MSALQKHVLRAQLPPFPPPGLPSSRAGQKQARNRRRDYTPVQWNQYFDSCEDVQVGENSFRVYRTGNAGPLLVLIHGGGFSALTWSLFSQTVTSLVGCQVMALDLRGHGDTKTTDDEDLSAATQAKDIGDVIKTLFEDDPPPVILIGHSMGGALAVHVASAGLIPSLIGVAVIDVVEGTAMDALASMNSFLRSRPTHFNSIHHAIEWCVRSGQVRNLDSARVSMPGQIKNCETGLTATSELAHLPAETLQDLESGRLPTLSESAIQEENEDCVSAEEPVNQLLFKEPLDPVDAQKEKQKYTWRIDLSQTERFWPGWFSGLSATFLSISVPKLLLLAGIDRLDKELTVGQMQGKFQMQVLPQCGHAVHEDVPDRVADVMATFMVRQKVAEPTANFERTLPAC